MLIRLQCGTRSGEVHDVLPTEARAMLADGRASLPDADPAAAPPVTQHTARVEARTDRVAPNAKRRSTR